MKGEVAIAGLLFTAEEWAAFDQQSRAQLVAVFARRDDSGRILQNGSLSEPISAPRDEDR